MIQQDYAAFSMALQRRLSAYRTPVNGTIEVTRRCPLECAHCYNNLPMGDMDARHRELTFEEHCRLLDEITDAGCIWLLYTGGEIFARKDFLDTYSDAKQKGLILILLTNGALHTPLAVRLTPEDIVELDLQDPERVDGWRSLYKNTSCAVPSAKQSEQVYICGGGISSFAVDPEGKMSICVLSHRDTYDLRTGSFREGWESFLSKVREKKVTRVTKCRACALKGMCTMCPANGELEHGDP